MCCFNMQLQHISDFASLDFASLKWVLPMNFYCTWIYEGRSRHILLHRQRIKWKIPIRVFFTWIYTQPAGAHICLAEQKTFRVHERDIRMYSFINNLSLYLFVFVFYLILSMFLLTLVFSWERCTQFSCTVSIDWDWRKSWKTCDLLNMDFADWNENVSGRKSHQVSLAKGNSLYVDTPRVKVTQY